MSSNGTSPANDDLTLRSLFQHVFGFLAAVSWVQCLHYGHRKRSKWYSVACLALFMVAFGAVEVLGVFTIRVRLKPAPSALETSRPNLTPD